MKAIFANTLMTVALALAVCTAADGQSSVRNQRGQVQNRQSGQTNQSSQTKPALRSATDTAREVQPQRATEEQDASQTSEQPQNPATEQTTLPDRRSRLQQQKTTSDRSTDLSERARIKNELNSKQPSHIVWLREIYRVINLDSANNAALKFPVQPVGDRVNLFTLIFRLLAEDKIDAYNYLADKEADFSEKEKAKFDEILKNNQIPFITEGSGANLKYKIEEIDIPSQDVTEYLIKEGWFFDEATGQFKSQVIAICPTIVRFDYNDNTTHKTNVCWIPYENIRPYLSRSMIMTSDFNNALTYTMDDYFTKNMYQGEIIKTVNMKNLTLAQQVGNEPEALRHAQDSIETQLRGFEKQLWVQPDTTITADKGKKTKAAKTVKAEKPKGEKTEKASSGPAKSVRRNK